MKYLSLIMLFVLCQLTLNAQNKTYWWNDQVFYEIFVRSFYDSNGDGIGDFKGLTKKLDYLNDGNPSTTTDLGVTALWLMPIMESPSYHGYDVTDYYKIEHDYGTNQDFKDFLDSAHTRGIKVIIDLVLNHTSDQHPWFQNSRSSANSTYRNWYVWSSTNPGIPGPWGESVWNSYGGNFYYSVFTSSMPDLNFFNPAVKNEVSNIVKYWLDSVKVDGFRLDAVRYYYEEGNVMADAPSTFSYLRDFRNYYKSCNPDAMAVGEAWTNTTSVVPYVDGTGIDFCFEFDTATDIINGINSGNPQTLITQMNNLVTTKYPFLQYGTFLTNHDQVRIYSQLNNNINKSKLAAGILLTMPGVPFLYYGEEIGMTSNGDDPSKRTPMQWTAGTNAGFTTGNPWHSIPSTYSTFNVDKMNSDSTSLLSWYKKLIRIREQYSSLRRGVYVPLTSLPGVYAFARYNSEDNDITFSIHNFSSGPIYNPTLSISNSSLPSGLYNLKDLITGNIEGNLYIIPLGKIESTLYISLPAYSSLVLKADLSTGIYDKSNLTVVKTFKLDQNYPNPFNPTTTISFEIQSTGNVKLSVYNLLGQEVKKLLNENLVEGMHSVEFDAKGLTSGLYIYKLESSGHSLTRKMILLK
jgi:glycosidase